MTQYLARNEHADTQINSLRLSGGRCRLWLDTYRRSTRPTGLRDKVADPGAERDFLEDINPDSVRTIAARLEASLKEASAEDRFQFERHGYFVADRVDSRPGAPVFNRTLGLKDSWAKSK